MLKLKQATGVFFLLLTAAHPCNSASPDGWYLRQSGEIVGARNVFLRADAIRVDSPKSGYSIVSKAPDWRVTIYNRRSRKFIDMPHDAFRGDTTSKLYSGDRSALSNGIWTKANKVGKFAGHPVSTYTMKSTKLSMSLGNRITDAKLSVFKDISIEPKAYDILRYIYQLPTIVGVPVEVTFFDLEDKFVVNPLRTHKIDNVVLTDSEFSLPQGLSKTKNLMEVLVDPVSHDAYEGFANWSAPDLKISGKKPR